MTNQESFDAWWLRLVTLASDQGREKYLKTKGNHVSDWASKLKPEEVIEYRLKDVLHRQTDTR